jgi:hypothetical protein
VADASGQTAACQFSITVNAAPAVFKCPLGKGYWKTQLSAWPVEQLTLGSQPYNQNILNVLLRTSVRGDASLILASELIPALLNVAHQADPRPAAAAIEAAQQLLAGCVGPLPCQVPPSSVIGKRMLGLAAELEAFNSGRLTPDCKP